MPLHALWATGVACTRIALWFSHGDIEERDVKYADGPSVEKDVLIDAPLEAVWSLVTDINLPAQFSSEFRGAAWIDDGPAPGARFVGRNAHQAIGEWETTSFLTRYEPPRMFGWDVSDPDNPSASWWFALTQEPDAVRLRQGCRIGPAPSGLTAAIEAMPDKEERIIARRLSEHEANIVATLEGIKQIAEARG
jgi:uncharacterized protein YndB with AHSA1/START domain